MPSASKASDTGKAGSAGIAAGCFVDDDAARRPPRRRLRRAGISIPSAATGASVNTRAEGLSVVAVLAEAGSSDEGCGVSSCDERRRRRNESKRVQSFRFDYAIARPHPRADGEVGLR